MIGRRAFLAASTILGLGARVAAAPPTARSAREAGFAAPLEADRHERTFMQWPSRARIYGGGRGLENVRSRIVAIARVIARFEPVVVLARPDQAAEAERALGGKIEIWPIPTEDLWCRDSGPTFVRAANGDLAVSELNFNGWGGRQVHADDGLIARRVAEKLGLPVYESGIVGEAGGVELDGAGTAIAHESCWINPNRNRLDKPEVERRLLAALGCEKMIWAPGVKGADITDYHIDALARFVRPGLVVIQLGEAIDRSDPWSVAAFETYEILKSARDAGGRKLDIVVLPEPDPYEIRSEAEDFVSSYVNYYICNGAIVGAEFGDDKTDEKAQRILKQLYPGREIISLDVDPIGEAGGGIHCATQQQPAATRREGR